MPRRWGQGRTPHRTIRVEDELWEPFEAATKAIGADRSEWLREAIAWCVHAPGAKMPKRPPASAVRR